MKKLRLSELNLDNTEVLAREELRKVLGGMGSGGDGGSGGTGSGGGGCCTVDNCQGGTRCFYSGYEGCGYAVCMGLTDAGCLYTLDIVSPPPCGWA